MSLVQKKFTSLSLSLDSVAKLAQGTLVDLIDLFHDLSKLIQKRGDANATSNENTSANSPDKLGYSIKGWSLIGQFATLESIARSSSRCRTGLFIRRHICSFEMLTTPHLEQLVNSVRRYVDSHLRSSIFKCPLPPKDEGMLTESSTTTSAAATTTEAKPSEQKKISLRELRILTKQ